MSKTIIDFPLDDTYCITQGDTIDEILITFSEDEDIDLTAEGVLIRMQVYNRNTVIIEVEQGNGITIVSEKVCKIDEVPYAENTLPHGVFMGDLEITDANGKRLTYFKVRYTITEQYTKP